MLPLQYAAQANMMYAFLQSQQTLAAKEQQTSFYSHWTGGGGGICGRLNDVMTTSDASRSPTSTSPPTPLASHPQPPASLTSSQNGHRSPVQTSPSVQSPIGPRVAHRKSNSCDVGRAPGLFGAFAPQQQHQTLHQQTQQQQQHAHGSARVLNSNTRSPKPQHAQHTLPAGPGAMSSLLGLTHSSSGSESSNGLRGLRTSKSLQQKSNGRAYGSRGSENGGGHLLSSMSHNLGAASPSFMQQGAQGLGGQYNNGFSYSNVQSLAHQADSFHRQLHIS